PLVTSESRPACRPPPAEVTPASLMGHVAHDTALSKLSCPELTQGLPSKPRANRVGAPRRDERGRARAQTRRSGNPKRGKSVAVSRNDVIDVTRSPESSSTMSAQGVRPPSRYCANAVEPHAAVRTSREPRHPEPRPSSHARIASLPRSQSVYGGIESVASSRSSVASESTS